MESLPERIGRVRQKVLERRRTLAPPLAESQVEEFERAQSIMLPVEFRRFVLEVGDGGQGPPYYGLMPLSNTLQDEVGIPVTPSLNFPLCEFWVWEGEDILTEELKLLMKEVRHQGYLFLGTDGCGYHWILIVTGKARGQIWLLAESGAQPCAPTRDFLAWYEFWLDGGEDQFSEFVWPHGKPTTKP